VYTEDCIVETAVWTESRSLVQFPEFIAKRSLSFSHTGIPKLMPHHPVIPTLHTRLGQKSKSNGAPTLIFVAEAALRVVEVTRALKDGKLRGDKGGEVAKLFARHFKLQDHVSYLKRTKVGAAVGTPGRIGKLLEAGECICAECREFVL
jgi:protein CMS1